MQARVVHSPYLTRGDTGTNNTVISQKNKNKTASIPHTLKLNLAYLPISNFLIVKLTRLAMIKSIKTLALQVTLNCPGN